MLSFGKIEFVSYAQNANERSCIVADIFVDTSDELPAADGIDDYTLLQGSFALIVTEGKLAVLSGDGKWYANGEAIS